MVQTHRVGRHGWRHRFAHRARVERPSPHPGQWRVRTRPCGPHRFRSATSRTETHRRRMAVVVDVGRTCAQSQPPSRICRHHSCACPPSGVSRRCGEMEGHAMKSLDELLDESRRLHRHAAVILLLPAAGRLPVARTCMRLRCAPSSNVHGSAWGGRNMHRSPATTTPSTSWASRWSSCGESTASSAHSTPLAATAQCRW